MEKIIETLVKNYLIIFLVLLIIIICSFYGIVVATKNYSSFPSAEAILCVPTPKSPITTSADAICFAAHVNGIADSLQTAQKQAKYEGWRAEARRRQDFNGWEVRIRSMGKIFPSYVCKVLFTDNGSLMNREPICGYSK